MADVFLDRDGVIIRSRRDYVTTWDEVEPLSGALHAIRRLCQAGHRVVVFTNQSAVGRGLLHAEDLEEIHRRLSDLVGSNGGEISRYFVCPHRPSDECSCRKPHPGLLLEAHATMGADLASAFFVGDQLTDLEAAWAVGATKPILVLSGETQVPPARTRSGYLVAPDLSAAADLILAMAKR